MFRKVLFLTLLVAAIGAGAEEPYVAGKHYQAVQPEQPTSTPGKVEVVELFWYGCPHCYSFESTIQTWLKEKADYIEFVRIPAIFSRNWEIHARAFYAAEQLGVLETIHVPLFDALHRERRKLFDEDSLAGFFVEHGVEESAFRTAYNSFDVDSKARQAFSATRKYGITGVPAMVINGKFRSSAQATGDYENLLKLVDYLAAKEHEGQ